MEDIICKGFSATNLESLIKDINEYKDENKFAAIKSVEYQVIPPVFNSCSYTLNPTMHYAIVLYVK